MNAQEHAQQQPAKISWAILGAGDVAEVKSGPALQQASDSELLIVMRRQADRAEDFARRHGVPGWTTSVAEVLADERIDAVYIATPPSSHRELAIAVLRAGKHVYLEKPMATSAAEASAIAAAAAQSNNAKLVVAHYRRHVPAFMKVGQLIQQGAIGQVRLAEIDLRQPADTEMIAHTEHNWRIDPTVSGGGLFHDLAPHQLDLLLHWFGPPLDCTGVFAPHVESGLPCPDRVIGSIRFANDILFNGVWDFDAAPPDTSDRTSIIGTQGQIEFGFRGDRVTLHRPGKPPQEFEFAPLPHVQQPMIEQVVAYFLGKNDNPCPAADGVEVMQMIDRMATELA